MEQELTPVEGCEPFTEKQEEEGFERDTPAIAPTQQPVEATSANVEAFEKADQELHAAEDEQNTAVASEEQLVDYQTVEIPVPAPEAGISAPVEAPAEQAMLEELRREVCELRAALERQAAKAAALAGECEEFRALYPDTPLSELPDAVWEDVRQGMPLSAAFALSERRRLCRQQKADESNLQNKLRSPGKHAQDRSEYFSPDEVRAMTPAQVRQNYQRIMFSMQKWQ